MKREEKALLAADDLRKTIADLLALGSPTRILLTPGILVGLRILFAQLRVRRILLTGEEYYGESHFPGESVRIAPCEAIPELLRSPGFDAVIASPASWRGVRQPVAELFGRIREAFRDEAPLLVADCAHAGSIGFPPVRDLAADLICGDLEKWILPPDWSRPVAFLWIREERLFRQAVAAFRPFYLATPSTRGSTLARWLDPAHVLAVSRQLAELGVTREQLRGRHRANMALARSLARRLAPWAVPQTSILWLDDDCAGESSGALEKLGLVWRVPARGTRILCRSDVTASARLETLVRAGPGSARLGRTEA